MNKAPIMRNFVLMVFFAAAGLTMFTEGVRIVQILGLFFSGVACGAALVGIIAAVKARSTREKSGT